jgi:hypothetical protein
MKPFLAFILMLALSAASRAVTASPSGTTITPTSGGSIVDASGNVWTLNTTTVTDPTCNAGKGGTCGTQIVENGTLQAGTAASLLLYYNGVVYSENTVPLWWDWAGGKWVKVAGDPRPPVVITAPTVTCTPASIPVSTQSTCTSSQPVTTWSVSIGSISSGIFTAPATAGTAAVTATNAGGSGSFNITVTAAPPPTQTVPCTATYTNATGALAISCQLPTTLSSKKVKGVGVIPAAAGAHRIPRKVVPTSYDGDWHRVITPISWTPQAQVQQPQDNTRFRQKTRQDSEEAKRIQRNNIRRNAALKATATSRAVLLTWTASTDAGAAYNIYRLTGLCPTSGTTGFTNIGTAITATTYTDTTVGVGPYCYYATATLNGEESTPSNLVSANVLPAPPTSFGCQATQTGGTVSVNCTSH